MISSDETDRKLQAAARRRAWLQLHRDGVDYTDRVHRPKNDYKRRPKYRPKSVEDWDGD